MQGAIRDGVASGLRALRGAGLAAALLAALLAGVAALLAPRLPLAGELDHFVYDAWTRLTPSREPVNAVVIAAIDEPTLERFADTPLAFWQPQLAQALATLREVGVAVVGIDLIQSSSAETWLGSIGAGASAAGRSYEAAYRAQLAAGGVVLAAARGSRGDLLPPLEDQLLLPGGLGDVGLVNLPGDDDGVVRHLRLRRRGAAPDLSFAARLADAARGGLALEPADAAAPGRLIPFSGPPGTVPRISLQTLIGAGAARRAEVRALRGKMVIIAPEAGELQDMHLTPYARALPGMAPQWMSGGEVQAQMVNALLHGRRIGIAPAALGPALAALAALLLALAVRVLLPWPSTGVAIGVLLALLLGSGLAFQRGVWLAPAPPLLGAGVGWFYLTVSRSGREARERARLRGLFARYISPNLVDHLVRHPEAVVLGGSKRCCSFVFSDLEGFTAMIESLDPETAVGLLNDYLEGMIAVAFAHRGTLDRIVGDAVAIMFSAPLEQPEHRAMALRCALAMSAFAEDFAARARARGVTMRKTRFGVHTGEVIVGNFGGRTIFDYRALGDPVNAASRLESANRHLGTHVCVSEATLQGCPQQPVRPVGRLTLKGKSRELMVYEPLQGGPDPAYEAAYAALETDAARALELFGRLAAARPDDGLVHFHLRRLQAGEAGVSVRFAEK